MPGPCQHLAAVNSLKIAPQHVCPECVALGEAWGHLRVCQAYGHVGCCDSSQNKHATKHFHSTQHPVVSSSEPGERWLWCYVDNQMAEY